MLGDFITDYLHLKSIAVYNSSAKKNKMLKCLALLTKTKKHPINICITQHEQTSPGNNVGSEDFETFIPHTFIDIKSVFLYMILHFFYHLLLTSIQTF